VGLSQGGNAMAYDVPQLLQMTQNELDDLFRASEAGPIPDGEADGAAIIKPGTPLSPEIEKFLHIFVWKGKIFDAKAGHLVNRIGILDIPLVAAKVYKAPSLLDGKECIVLDYSKTSFVAQHIRDEIRLISPKFYLGKVYWDNRPWFDFSLKF
jgi:hypothetical protein